MAGSLVLNSRKAHTQDPQNPSEDQPCVQPNPVAQLRSFGAGRRSQAIERSVKSHWIYPDLLYHVFCRFAGTYLYCPQLIRVQETHLQRQEADRLSALRLDERSQKAIAFKLPGNSDEQSWLANLH